MATSDLTAGEIEAPPANEPIYILSARIYDAAANAPDAFNAAVTQLDQDSKSGAAAGVKIDYDPQGKVSAITINNLGLYSSSDQGVPGQLANSQLMADISNGDLQSGVNDSILISSTFDVGDAGGFKQSVLDGYSKGLGSLLQGGDAGQATPYLANVLQSGAGDQADLTAVLEKAKDLSGLGDRLTISTDAQSGAVTGLQLDGKDLLGSAAETTAPTQTADSTTQTPTADSTAPTLPADSTAPTPTADSTATTPTADSTAPTPTADSTATTPTADSTVPTPTADSTAPTLPADSTAQTPTADSSTQASATDTPTSSPVDAQTANRPEIQIPSQAPAVDSASVNLFASDRNDIAPAQPGDNNAARPDQNAGPNPGLYRTDTAPPASQVPADNPPVIPGPADQTLSATAPAADTTGGVRSGGSVELTSDTPSGPIPAAADAGPAVADTTKQTELDQHERHQFEKLVSREIDHQNLSSPVRRGEGYFQVVERMHSDWTEEQVNKEAHRIKDINGHRDELKIGERLPMISKDEKASEVQAQMDKFDQASPEQRAQLLEQIKSQSFSRSHDHERGHEGHEQGREQSPEQRSNTVRDNRSYSARSAQQSAPGGGGSDSDY